MSCSKNDDIFTHIQIDDIPPRTEPENPSENDTTANIDPATIPNDIWWNDEVFYEIFIRSFQDSDGDGIGDIQGLINRLDYLNDGDPETTTDLGVTGLWLMPIFPSPSYHGYDVVNYRDIHPDYGTLEDFRRLLNEAHKRGIKVIIDFVGNHTSSQHPWLKHLLQKQVNAIGTSGRNPSLTTMVLGVKTFGINSIMRTTMDYFGMGCPI